MPEWLRAAFYDETRWQPYMPFLGIPNDGYIVKVSEAAFPNRPYAGFLYPSGDVLMLHTTRRKINLDLLSGVKFYRLREGVFQYEIDEVNRLKDGYRNYIRQCNP